MPLRVPAVGGTSTRGMWPRAMGLAAGNEGQVQEVAF